MTDKARAALPGKVDDNFDVAALLRLGGWGLAAAFAVVVAVFAASTNFGARRAPPPAPVVATQEPVRPAMPQPPTAAQLLARANEPDAETKRLAEAVRLLTADRDRLTTRIAAIERTMDDLTGSIARLPPAAPPARAPDPAPSSAPRQEAQSAPPAIPLAVPAPFATNPQPMPVAMAPAPRPIAPPTPMPDPAPLIMAPPPASAMTGPSDVPTARSGRMATIEYYTRSSADPAAARADDPANSVTTATDFGIDLGGANSVNGLRALWATIRGKHAQLLNGLWPVMVIRDRPKQPGVVELRLVAGPLPNAGHAAKLCAALAPLGVPCQPAVFDGQRLALR
jgi:hypothetical protein